MINCLEYKPLNGETDIGHRPGKPFIGPYVRFESNFKPVSIPFIKTN